MLVFIQIGPTQEAPPSEPLGLLLLDDDNLALALDDGAFLILE